jgi:hypothetical protein
MKTFYATIPQTVHLMTYGHGSETGTIVTELVLSLIPVQVKELLRHICPYSDERVTFPENFDLSDVRTPSTVSMVLSAIKWFYLERDVRRHGPICNEEIVETYDTLPDWCRVPERLQSVSHIYTPCR